MQVDSSDPESENPDKDLISTSHLSINGSLKENPGLDFYFSDLNYPFLLKGNTEEISQLTWNHLDGHINLLPVVHALKFPVQDEVAVVSHHRTLWGVGGALMNDPLILMDG